MAKRSVVHDEMARSPKGTWLLTWCGRTTRAADSLVHKRPNCKTCRKAVAAYRRRERAAQKEEGAR